MFRFFACFCMCIGLSLSVGFEQRTNEMDIHPNRAIDFQTTFTVLPLTLYPTHVDDEIRLFDLVMAGQ